MLTKPTNSRAASSRQGDSGEYYDHPLLIEESPLQVLPSLAEAVGLNEAIVIQQLHYLLRNPKNGKFLNGERWIFNTYEQWREEYFPFWSEITIKRLFIQLEKMHIVESCQPEGSISRRKYYRLNAGMARRLTTGRVLRPKKSRRYTKDTIDVSGSDVPLTETSSKKTKETKESASAKPLNFSSEFKSSELSKEEKLARIKPPSNYPTEDEFNDFLADNCPDIESKVQSPYRDLCINKWHCWSKQGQRWMRIRDWRFYIMGLNKKIEDATDRGF